ncbi:MAG: hypothetical protein JSS55_18395 [Proteobacteria bacterium]|nr:hypothetical protein [Pseudomonadota bacterium]
MLPRSGTPAQGWKTFLANHADAIVGIDMLSVPTLTFGRLYAFVVLAHGRRAILHVEVTDHPTARWLAFQITRALAGSRMPDWLIRDNDRAYGHSFRRRVRALGVRDSPIGRISSRPILGGLHRRYYRGARKCGFRKGQEPVVISDRRPADAGADVVTPLVISSTECYMKA